VQRIIVDGSESRPRASGATAADDALPRIVELQVD